MKKNWKKIILILAVVGVVLLGAAYAGYKGYRHVRQVRLVKQAKAFLEKSEDRKALLCLQRALRINGRDVEASPSDGPDPRGLGPPRCVRLA